MSKVLLCINRTVCFLLCCIHCLSVANIIWLVVAASIFVLIRSAGCILFELAALKRPFDGLSLMDVMYKVTEVDPPSWPAAYAADLAALFTRLFFVENVFLKETVTSHVRVNS